MWLENQENFIRQLFIPIVCLGIIGALSFGGCPSDDDDDDNDTTEYAYFPTAQGNIWYFIVRDTVGQEGSGTSEILADENFNGYEAIPMEVKSTSSGSESVSKAYLQADQHQVQILGGKSGEDILAFDAPLGLLQFPLSTGASWTSITQFDVSGYVVDVTAQTTVENFEDITVQGTAYTECYRLLTTMTFEPQIYPIEFIVPIRYWLAPDIGPIKAIASVPDIFLFPDLPSGDYTYEVTGTNF